MNLGTEKHFKKYYNDINSLQLPGCFALTGIIVLEVFSYFYF